LRIDGLITVAFDRRRWADGQCTDVGKLRNHRVGQREAKKISLRILAKIMKWKDG
jgi:hypothetical protein